MPVRKMSSQRKKFIEEYTSLGRERVQAMMAGDEASERLAAGKMWGLAPRLWGAQSGQTMRQMRLLSKYGFSGHQSEASAGAVKGSSFAELSADTYARRRSSTSNQADRAPRAAGPGVRDVHDRARVHGVQAADQFDSARILASRQEQVERARYANAGEG